MPGRAPVVFDDVDVPFLEDVAVYRALPVYAELADAAVRAEMEWLKARTEGAVGSKQLLDAYTASLVPRRCRLSGTLLARTRAPGGHKAHEADLYVRIRLATSSFTYRDRIYECHYTAGSSEAALATIQDLSEAKISEDVNLFGWLERSFSVPGFYLARARLYRGPSNP
jgi:hypothetical protein